ncbi:MAG: site-2 protease family protein [Nannocystaceae bacterium]
MLSDVTPWSWNIGRYLGIDVRVHATFLLLVAWVSFRALEQGGTLLAAAMAITFLLAVFASVLLHEFGHALTARHFGAPTRQIILSPLGGVAQIDGALPARAELWVALAGPIVSFLLAGVFFTVAALTGAWSPASFIGGLGWANLIIAAFNMLPAFPMDGGRVLRAALSLRIGHYRATEIAARIGRYAGVGLIAFSLFSGRPLLALIGGFVYLTAAAEARMVRAAFDRGPWPGDARRREPGPRGPQPTWWTRWRSRAPEARATQEGNGRLHRRVVVIVDDTDRMNRWN